VQFLYHPDAGLPSITVEGEAYRYLFKVRRFKMGDRVALRNFLNDYINHYRIERIDKKEATLLFLEKEELRVMPKKLLHIGWCVIDPKSVEKSIPMLNELGVAQISFIYCDRSQKNFRIDFKRLERILINSSQQCGRSELMKLELFDSLKEFLKAYPKSAFLDFGGTGLMCDTEVDTIIVGCEGGFSDEERKLFADLPIYGLDIPTVLRSETAVVAVASRLI